MLKTSACGLGFQHLPRDIANVNAWKTMFDPYNTQLISVESSQRYPYEKLFPFLYY